MPAKEIRFEGYFEEEILHLPEETIDGLVLIGQPIVFRTGTAVILGSFRINAGRLVLELAQIDGGGEGVLISLGSLARRFARVRGLHAVEWIVHAVHCAEPNLKLRRMLERRGFVIETIPEIGEAYHLIDSLTA
jgi:hypothetical protein